MGTSPTLLALWNLLLLVVLGALVWLLTWALFGDRHWRTLRRCPRCGHDMRGTDGLRCGECGAVAKSEAGLHRRQRRWWLATASFLALMSLAIYLRSAWSQSPWATMVPDRVAIWLLPRIDPAGPMSEAIDELGARMARGLLGDADVERLVERLLAGDDRAPPGSVAWLRKYGRLLERWQMMGRHAFLEGDRSGAGAAPPEPASAQRLAVVERFDRRIDRLPPVLTVASPARWIESEPLSIELVVERTWGRSAPTRLVVESLDLGSISPQILPPVDAPISLHDRSSVTARIPLRFEPVPAGVHDGAMRVRIENADADGAWSSMRTTEVPVSIAVSATLAELLAPDSVPPAGAEDFPATRNDELDATIAELLAPGLIRWARGQRRFALRLNPSADVQARLQGIALGIEAEILEDGVVRRRLRLWWPGDGRLRFEPPQENAEALARAREGDGRWTLRVRGVRELSLRAALADRTGERRTWWNGIVERPLRITDDDGEAMLRPWTILPQEPLPSPEPSPSLP